LDVALSQDLGRLLDDLDLLLRLVDDLLGDWDVLDVLDLSLLWDILGGISGLRDVLSVSSLDWHLFDVLSLDWDLIGDGGVVNLRHILDLVLDGVVISDLSGNRDLFSSLDGLVVGVGLLDRDVLGDSSLLIVLVLSGVWHLLELGLSSVGLFQGSLGDLDLRLLDIGDLRGLLDVRDLRGLLDVGDLRGLDVLRLLDELGLLDVLRLGESEALLLWEVLGGQWLLLN